MRWILKIARKHLEAWSEQDRIDLEATLRESAEERARQPIIPMAEHLAKLPPPPPMFEPEWANDNAWRDDRKQ